MNNRNIRYWTNTNMQNPICEMSAYLLLDAILFLAEKVDEKLTLSLDEGKGTLVIQRVGEHLQPRDAVILYVDKPPLMQRKSEFVRKHQ